MSLPTPHAGRMSVPAAHAGEGGACEWVSRDLLVHEVVGLAAARCPDATAVEVVTDALLRADGGGAGAAGPDVYTYADIEAMASALALELRALGAADRDEDEPKVGMLVEEGVGLVVCELAVLKAGAAFVPLDPTWPSDRLGFILRDCHARVVLLPRAAAPALRKKLQAAGLVHAGDSNHTMGAAANLPDADAGADAHAVLALEWEAMLEKKRGCMGGFSGAAAGDDGEVGGRGGGRPGPVGRLPPARGAKTRGQRCSHLIYTSGTSGQPKGVICEHRGLVNYMHAKARAHELIPPARGGAGGEGTVSRVLVTAAATWDPSLGDIFSTLGAGAVVCLAPRAALLANLAQVLQVSRATHVCTTPALWDLLPDHYGPAHLPHLRVLALGGAPFPRHYIPRWCPAQVRDAHPGSQHLAPLRAQVRGSRAANARV